MIDIGDIVGNIASVCSIIGLPIALYQISAIKSKAEATEAGLNRLLEMKENESLEQICTQIFNQQQELAKIQASMGKEGIEPKRQAEKCESIINELNQCIFQIPVKYEIVTKTLECCTACLQDYLKNNSDEKLKEASDYLYTVLRRLKKAKEKNVNEQLRDIAHQ